MKILCTYSDPKMLTHGKSKKKEKIKEIYKHLKETESAIAVIQYSDVTFSCIKQTVCAIKKEENINIRILPAAEQGIAYILNVEDFPELNKENFPRHKGDLPIKTVDMEIKRYYET